ncbi:hypothetical protein THAOC_04242 [Thalassiosira oceanica]|uniref:Uncharacterized protein n=2 Tax=Thalassiosira oceanica TaxID=159749 RepID=K0T5Q3_THAOC|nr:hypothetical protein THAOC_04242 [Thalassiosira oceanica]|eukprot:EJK74108.1 hypothetical protein THAOC_04242 [Thalassiosira oceanica]
MKLAAAALTVGAVSASSIPANSKTGRSIMSKARRLDQGDMTWAANYSIKFEKCATSNDYYGGYFGGNNNNQNNNGNAAGYNGMYEQRLVHFKLCPSDTCGSDCSNGADYVVDMSEFVEAYLEEKAEAQEKACETAKQSCEYNCQNANDDETQCLNDLGLTECMEDDQNQDQGEGQQGEEFDLQEAMECRRLDVDEEAAQYYAYQNNMNNGNWNNQQNGQQQMEFFVGPYCSSDGMSILLGVFMDEVCSFEAPSGVYERFNYGQSLPYSSESLISNECISCMEVKEDENQNQENENGDNNNQQEEEEVEVKEMCERLYEPAAKCEGGLTNIYGLYPNTMGCQFIDGLTVSGKARIMATISNVSNAAKQAAKSATPGVLAGVFALTTLIFAGVAYHFHGKASKQKSPGLVSGSGGDMA